MPWRERVTLISTQPNDDPGEDDVLTDVVTVGGELEDSDASEQIGGGVEGLQDSMTFVIPRTRKVEEALKGTARRNPVTKVRVGAEDRLHAISRVTRLYPGRVRISTEREQ